MPIPPSLFIATTNEAVLFTYWSAARFTVRSGPPYNQATCLALTALPIKNAPTAMVTA